MIRKLARSGPALVLAMASCAQTPPPAPAPHVRRVVLVHGFLETGSTFRMLRKRLEKRGIECLVPRLKPNDGRGGLEMLAAGLKNDIDREFGPTEPISIIAFSMGGLVSRYYLQDLGGADRCENLITISSPHQGTLAAWCYPTRGARQMRPGSGFLADLGRTQNQLGEKIPLVSYRTPDGPHHPTGSNSIWDRAENLEYPVIAHPMMLTSRPVLDDIESRLMK